MPDAAPHTAHPTPATDTQKPPAAILHLMPEAAWSALADDEGVRNPSLDTDGFMHCTDDPDVMLQVANAFYRSDSGSFVVLHVEIARLRSRCLWEAPAHPRETEVPPLAVSFPHVYGPIDRSAVVRVQPVTRDASGLFTGYGELQSSV